MRVKSLTLLELILAITIGGSLILGAGAAFIKGFQTFSFINAEMAGVQKISYALEHIARYAIGGLKYKISDSGEKITIDVDTDFDGEIDQQRVYSLVDNEIRYSQGGSEAVLAANISSLKFTKISKTYFTVEVRTEVGIPPKELIFTGGIDTEGILYNII